MNIHFVSNPLLMCTVLLEERSKEEEGQTERNPGGLVSSAVESPSLRDQLLRFPSTMWLEICVTITKNFDTQVWLDS